MVVAGLRGERGGGVRRCRSGVDRNCVCGVACCKEGALKDIVVERACDLDTVQRQPCSSAPFMALRLYRSSKGSIPRPYGLVQVRIRITNILVGNPTSLQIGGSDLAHHALALVVGHVVARSSRDPPWSPQLLCDWMSSQPHRVFRTVDLGALLDARTGEALRKQAMRNGNAKERQEGDSSNMHASKHSYEVQARGPAARAVVCVPELARCKFPAKTLLSRDLR